jgi:Bax protein
MKIQYFIKLVILSALVIALIAPFTFMRPVDITVPEVAVKAKKVVKVTPVAKVKIVERPLHNVKIPDFAAIRDVKTKKREFFQYIYPAIEQENKNLLQIRTEVEVMIEAMFLEENLLD